MPITFEGNAALRGRAKVLGNQVRTQRSQLNEKMKLTKDKYIVYCLPSNNKGNQ